MKVIILNQKHRHYNRTGELVARRGDEWIVRIPHKNGGIQTTAREHDFRPIKRQD